MVDIKSFGCLHSEPKKFGFFCSKWMFDLLYRRKKSADELMSDAVERISVFAKYHDIAGVTLVSADPESEPVATRIKDKLNLMGVTVSYINLWDGDKLTVLCEESMSDKDNYILCLMPRATRIADVDKVLSVASDYEKKVVGTVAI